MSTDNGLIKLLRLTRPDHIGRWLLQHFYLRRMLVIGWYLLGVFVCYYSAFLLRFESEIREVYWHHFTSTLPILVLCRVTVFHFFNLFAGIWRFVSFADAIRTILAVVISSVVFAVCFYIYNGFTFSPFPRSVMIIDCMLYACYCVGGRIVLRLIRETGMLEQEGARNLDGDALVIGNLLHVNALFSSLSDNPSARRRIVGILCAQGDFQTGNQIHGVRILGTQSEVGEVAIATGVHTILVVEPFTAPHELKAISNACTKAGARVQLRMIPSVTELMGDRVNISSIRNVGIEDLLGRPTVRFDRKEVEAYMSGRNVMITGAGGSIGSELVRQLSRYGPRRLVLFENNEFALYQIHSELAEKQLDCEIIPIAGDVRFRDEITRVMKAYQIHVVFHTAAYKHVPLMEANVVSAMRTNVLGSYEVARAADAAGVKRLILVSTDKAVRPTSIMGATKRLAEMIMTGFASSSTEFVIVRFGNVIGSSGSVIPIFKQQIANGGPVTVTTADATRYFMTIPEAVDLLLQAGTIGNDGDVMVLEMGQPVKIDEMARRLIELSGFIPDVDIKVSYIGLRPGEKEYEELLTGDEGVTRTPYDKIWVLSKNGVVPPTVDVERVRQLVDDANAEKLRDFAVSAITDQLLETKNA